MIKNRYRVVLLTVGLLFGVPSALSVQPEPPVVPPGEVTMADIRAAYLISIMRYVRWPHEDGTEALRIGILGESPVYEVLNELPLPPLRGHQIHISALTRTSQIPQVDLLYVSPRTAVSLDQVFSQAQRNSVLVVTEDTIIRDDMMINLISGSNNRLAFQVNEDRIHRAGLTTSPELLLLHGSELDVVIKNHQLMRERSAHEEQLELLESTISEQNSHIEQMQERIDALEQTLRERDDVLRAQQGSLEDKQQLMDSQEDALNVLLTELEEQRELLFAREEQLRTIQQALAESEQSLQAKELELEEKEGQLANKEREGDALSQRISANRDILAAQQQQLRDQRAALAEQAELLESRERTIDRQRDYLIYILTALLIASLLGALSLILYVKKRHTARQLMNTLNDLHEAQDKLVESEKMAALGNLVAGVAHEVNTPLGVALTATSMLNDRRELLAHNVQNGDLTRDQLERFLNQAQESLTLTEKNLSRVARLISNFKQVAVDQMITERRTIDIGLYLEEIMSALSIELKRAHIDYAIETEGTIEMDTIPGAMAQIMTNLVTNSIRHGYEEGTDAEHKGTITIKARRADGNNVLITFCDDGTGMDNETLQRIFEPFFTTKRNQGGTGLGMPIVYNLVRQQLKGDITVSSEPGRGTCFELVVPRHFRMQ